MSPTFERFPTRWSRSHALYLSTLLLLVAGLVAEMLVMVTVPSHYAAVAQGTGVSSARRRPRPQALSNPNIPPSPTPRPPTGGENIGTTTQGLTSCNNGVFNFQDGVRAGGFAPNTYVLGLAPVSGEIYTSPDLVSFWMVANTSGGVAVAPDALSVVTTNGGDLYGTLLAGQMADGRWLLTGWCANYYDRLNDQQIASMYYDYYNVDNPALTGLTPSVRDAIAQSNVYVTAAQSGTELTIGELTREGVSLSPAVLAVINAALPYTDEGALAPGSTVSSTVDSTEGDRWTFYGAAGDLVTVDVTGDFDTLLSVLDSSGAELAANDDRGDGTTNSLLQDLAIPYSDTYTVNVRGYDGVTGGAYQLSLAVTPASQPDSDQISEGYADEGELPEGTISGSLSSSDGDLYTFNALAGQSLSVQMESGALDPLLELWDEYGNVIDGNDDRADGDLNAELWVVLPYSGTYYLVASSYEGAGRGDYTLTAFRESSGADSVTEDCSGSYGSVLYVGALAQTASGNRTRVRSEPSTSAEVYINMEPGQPATVLDGPVCVDGRVWWQVSYSGYTGWSAEIDNDGERLLVLTGDGGFVPATPAPSSESGGQSFEGAQLNNGLGAAFGDVELASGFGPDPFPISIGVSGLNADAGALGGPCVGLTQEWPTLRIVYEAGSFPMVRFYFVPDFETDTVMVINDPNGGWYCSDDSFGTLNPTIDFGSPASGGYQIWIGTLGGDDVGGTIYVTEVDGNHP